MAITEADFARRFDENREKYSDRAAKNLNNHLILGAKLGEALELDHDDEDQVHDYVMISVALTGSYIDAKLQRLKDDTERLKSNALLQPVAHFLISRKIENYTDLSLIKVAHSIRKDCFLFTWYPSIEENMYARELDLSVHEITTLSKTGKPLGKTVPIDFKLVPEWAERWKPRLVRPNSSSITHPAD